MNFEKPSQENYKDNEPEVENIDEYEREKIERTLADAEHLVEVIKNYLEMIKFCDEKGIKAENRTSLDMIRGPKGVAGPDSDMSKLRDMFMSGQVELKKNIHIRDKKELEERLIK